MSNTVFTSGPVCTGTSFSVWTLVTSRNGEVEVVGWGGSFLEQAHHGVGRKVIDRIKTKATGVVSAQ